MKASCKGILQNNGNVFYRCKHPAIEDLDNQLHFPSLGQCTIRPLKILD